MESAIKICGSPSRAARSATLRLFTAIGVLNTSFFTTETGQKEDITNYINGSVNQTRRTGNGKSKQDKGKIVIETLEARADGM